VPMARAIIQGGGIGRGGTVHAFEPDNFNANLLHSNTVLNGLSHVLRPHRAIVSARSEETRMALFDHSDPYGRGPSNTPLQNLGNIRIKVPENTPMQDSPGMPGLGARQKVQVGGGTASIWQEIVPETERIYGGGLSYTGR